MIDLDSIFSEPAAVPEPALKLLFAEPVDDVVDDPFAGWVRRPDHRGQVGWEAPDLPEWQRWWARGDFEDFPEVPPDFEYCPLTTAH